MKAKNTNIGTGTEPDPTQTFWHQPGMLIDWVFFRVGLPSPYKRFSWTLDGEDGCLGVGDGVAPTNPSRFVATGWGGTHRTAGVLSSAPFTLLPLSAPPPQLRGLLRAEYVALHKRLQEVPWVTHRASFTLHVIVQTIWPVKALVWVARAFCYILFYNLRFVYYLFLNLNQ